MLAVRLLALLLLAACSSSSPRTQAAPDATAARAAPEPDAPWVKIQSAPPSVGPEYDRLAKEAADASDRGDYKTALAKAEAALALDPERMAPLSVATTAACHLKDEAKAKRYGERLKGIWRDVAIDICGKAGVDLGIQGFLPDGGGA